MMRIARRSRPRLGSSEAQADYDIVRRLIEFITLHWREQPSLDRLAAEVGLDSLALQRLFTRWAGLTPKAFLQAVTLDHARALLASSASLLEASHELGLSGPGRLHDLFVTHQAITPGAFKSGGAGMMLRYGFHPSPFGAALIVASEYGLVGLAFADPGEEASVLADMTGRLPKADYSEDRLGTARLARRIFDPAQWRAEQPLRLVLIGTDFEISVWETLLCLPLGTATVYSDIATHIGRPKAARAVGAAVGRNPISFVVPCHRVLAKSGGLGGYHWGLTRKRAILGWEFGVAGLAAK